MAFDAAGSLPVPSRRQAVGAPSARGLLFTLLGEFVLAGDGTPGPRPCSWSSPGWSGDAQREWKRLNGTD